MARRHCGSLDLWSLGGGGAGAPPNTRALKDAGRSATLANSGMGTQPASACRKRGKTDTKRMF